MNGIDLLLIIALGFSFVLHLLYGFALVDKARDDDEDFFLR